MSDCKCPKCGKLTGDRNGTAITCDECIIKRLIGVVWDCKETITYAQKYFDKSISAYDDCEDTLRLIDEALKD